jgi:uncharacterized protein YggT (Ycf19 family)
LFKFVIAEVKPPLDPLILKEAIPPTEGVNPSILLVVLIAN